MPSTHYADSKLPPAKMRKIPNPGSGWLALLAIVPIFCVSAELNKFQQLIEAVYRLEVAAYCGLTTDTVIEGYQRLEEELIVAGKLDDAEIDRARGQAWQAAHAEWQNRGLGGFRAWCNTEGRDAARSLQVYAQ